jgi:lipopolysaccharide/colanic/teichoic acid biosynthesis glycosyltransferase
MLARNDHRDAAYGAAASSRSLERTTIRQRDGENFSITPYWLKRTFDIVFALGALFLLIPAFALIAILVRASGPGPVFYSQWRYGQNRKQFRIFKFRTMVCGADDGPVTVQTARKDARVTRIGAFLRRTSLDELPQFVNVLKGDMSIVGPRPHAPQTLIANEFYETLVADFDQRHLIRPGMTGLAQISGCRGPLPNAAAAIKRFEYDLVYLRQQSLLLDLRIIARTLQREFLTGSGY